MKLTAERARELLAYDPDTGAVRWRIRVGGRAVAGAIVGNVCKTSGYRNIRIDKKPYRLHRVIWLMQKGEWPFQIDHRNRDRSDNHWDNLRETCDALNLQNVEKARKDSTTGLKGVHADARRPGRFNAIIKRDGQHYWLGTFDTAEEAHVSYLNAKAQLHPAWEPSETVLDGVALTGNHLLNSRGGRRVRSDSSTGVLGVIPCNGRWRAVFKKRHLGVFDSTEKAHAAYMAARTSHFAQQAR